MSEEELYRLAERLGACLLERGLKLATAESCTGGWVAQCVTDVAGSSAWFERGFVTYSNGSKQELLGVPSSVLEAYGAVSEETVRAMAAGALNASRADCAVAVSGIAGPSGAVPGKPVGTVWFAWATHTGAVATRCARYEGDRRAVRRQAVAEALRGVLALYEEAGGGGGGA
ncbi:nicotinamide-nucleotide amidase [Methylococcus sp. EFPC2]|uniref:nicotinamide-nucleotide amidase n=1 Tax=Methylococcus sp. EFPC2 TaxID=2812648 RepID=UPI001F082DEB|nr:nicotinamide-nucleotide amidase [Methylococcus sp. EFPC2]